MQYSTRTVPKRLADLAYRTCTVSYDNVSYGTVKVASHQHASCNCRASVRAKPVVSRHLLIEIVLLENNSKLQTPRRAYPQLPYPQRKRFHARNALANTTAVQSNL